MTSMAVVVASLLMIALLELLWSRRRRKFPALRRRLGNIGIWILNVVLAGFVFASPATFRLQLAAALGVTLPAWPLANAAMGFVAGFLLLDLLQYAVHRCQHAIPLLWHLHALHHSDPDVDVTTSVRHHPIEYLITSAIYWLVVLALGIPALVAASHAATAFAAASITHGNIRAPEWMERLLQPVVITLGLHLIHHSMLQEQANANFGAVLSIWDRLFGTYKRLPRAELDQLVFGVRELAPADALKPSAMIMTPWVLRRAASSG